MSLMPCVNGDDRDDKNTTLPLRIAYQIEALRQERIDQYTRQTCQELPRAATGLEKSVDRLLDMLHDLHRLEQLAEHVARGGQITVEADRNLIASHEATYRSLLERHAACSPHARAMASALLPSTPPPLDE
ncbi:MAG: hypothetical protein RMJ43_15655 [Chloroherpetonaceae bacterium]|nr:hypothetical protein [Chthonomonadaceae bacterium]MDW8209270.1 hypothetical protein [Chloroherpetonaceae bacterium]